MKLKCTQCGLEQKVNNFIFKVRKPTGLPYACFDCGTNLYEHGEGIKKGRGTDNQKRSRRQEKRSAKDLGGHTQPASGAGSAKGDVRASWKVRAECKLTRGKSFSLKLADLEKIEKEAASPEMPILQLEYQGVYPHKQYVVMPYWLFQSLTED